jgi:hypothetical protein
MSNRWPGGIVRKNPVTPAGPLQNGAASGVWSLADAAYWTKQGLWPLAGNTLAVEDVFSTYLYTGTSANQTITNGIDLAGKGGMVWLKARSIGIENHYVYDTNRGASKFINTNRTNAQTDYSAQGWFLDAFTSTGFALDAIGDGNSNGVTYASWTFREAPKFFDVVTYTGTGTGTRIAHNLGVAPGMILVKSTSNSNNWMVYHRSTGIDNATFLNLTDASTSLSGAWGTSAPTATDFGLGPSYINNTAGQTYVAYLYAHDTASDGIIQCGLFTAGVATGTASVTLGWEPQWLLIKGSNSTAVSDSGGFWPIMDNMRGMNAANNAVQLQAQSTAAESTNSQEIRINSTGFTAGNMAGNSEFIYMAIRRGPMKTPTLGTSVFMPSLGSSSGQLTVTTNFPSDLAWFKSRGSSQSYDYDRLRGNQVLLQTTTDAESTGNAVWDSNTTFRTGDTGNFSNWAFWNFRRAPGFFDEVCYTGTSVARTLNHNLGVAPELLIIKPRSSTGSWIVGTTFGATTFTEAVLNSSDAGFFISYDNLINAAPTSTTFSVGSSSGTNGSGTTYVAYLFASAPGVSKVGSYTGNGSSQTINCGFAAGARFVLIKRTDSTGGWLVWDSARGIVAGNDPYVALNSTAAEVTSNDSVDTDNTGFIVNQVAASNVNVNAATYIFLAIA